MPGYWSVLMCLFSGLALMAIGCSQAPKPKPGDVCDAHGCATPDMKSWNGKGEYKVQLPCGEWVTLVEKPKPKGGS